MRRKDSFDLLVDQKVSGTHKLSGSSGLGRVTTVTIGMTALGAGDFLVGSLAELSAYGAVSPYQETEVAEEFWKKYFEPLAIDIDELVTPGCIPLFVELQSGDLQGEIAANSPFKNNLIVFVVVVCCCFFAQEECPPEQGSRIAYRDQAIQLKWSSSGLVSSISIDWFVEARQSDLNQIVDVLPGVCVCVVWIFQQVNYHTIFVKLKISVLFD